MPHYLIVKLDDEAGEAFRELDDNGWVDDMRIELVFPQTTLDGVLIEHRRNLPALK